MQSPNACKDCEKSMKKTGLYTLTEVNDMDPFPQPCGYPFHLPNPMPIEEMLFSRVHVIMKSYCLSNGSYGYRGHILNLEQDIANIVIAAILPWSVESLPVWIVQKVHEAIPGGYKDFLVQ